MTRRSAALFDGLIGFIPIVGLIAVWQALVMAGVAPPALLPSPGAVFSRFMQQIVSPDYVEHAYITLYRLFVGFGIAVLAGVAFGILMTGSRAVATIVRPIVRVLAPVPKIALYPAFTLTLGYDDASKIALVIADAMFPILLATYQGASAVEPKLAWSARAMGMSPLNTLFRVVLPAAMPSVLTGCRIGLVISCIVVFLAEMITSTDGLGHLLMRAARNFQTVDMFVPLITISMLGLLLNAGFNRLRRHLLRGFAEER
jgi:ABC-type nitrate/sulfonate/bicarbonate transport system permease component